MFRAKLILLWSSEHPQSGTSSVLYSIGIHIIVMLCFVKHALQNPLLRDSTSIQSMNIAKKVCSCFYMKETRRYFVILLLGKKN